MSNDKEEKHGVTSDKQESSSYSRECIECDAEHCDKSTPEKRCSRCHTVYYCNVKCQKLHWHEHKPYCIDVNKMRKKLAGVEKGDEDYDYNDVDTNVQCAICLEETAINPVIVPKCKHVFCFSCLAYWKEVSFLNSKVVCPMCRNEIESDRDIKLKGAFLYAARAQKKGLSSEMRNNFFDSALSEIDDVLKDEEEDLQFLVTKVELLCQDGRNSNIAIEIAQKLMNVNKIRAENSDQIKSILDQVQNAMDNGDDAEAERLMDIAQALKDGTNITRLPIFTTPLLLAQAYEVAGKWEEAKKTYKGMLTEMHSPDVGDPVQQRKVFMGICRVAYELGDYKHAQMAGAAALEMNRHFPGIHKYVALAQKESGDLDAAIKTMNRAVLYETPWDDDNIVENKKLFEHLVSSKE